MDLETVYTSDKVDASESFQKEEKKTNLKTKQTKNSQNWKQTKTQQPQKSAVWTLWDTSVFD